MSPLYLESIPLETEILKLDKRMSEEMKAERRKDDRDFYLLFALSFPFFLVAALAGRMIPGSAVTDNQPHKSIIAEASANAGSTIAIALTN